MVHLRSDYNPFDHRTLAFARGDDQEQQEAGIHEHYKRHEPNLPPFDQIFSDWQKLTEEMKSGDVLIVARFGTISVDAKELRIRLRELHRAGIIIEPVNEHYCGSLDHYREVEPYMDQIERYFAGLGELCQNMLKDEKDAES